MTQDPNKIIDALGGTTEVARLCEIEAASVSGWRVHGIPKARLMYLRLARPEVFKRIDGCDSRTGDPDMRDAA